MNRLALVSWFSLVLLVGLEARGLSDRFCLVHGDPAFMVELGAGWNRFDFNWDSIEREKGVFDFRDLPARVDESLALGVNILPILDYNPAWNREVSPADEETLGYWERYVERTVAQFRGKLPYWQVWNEPNISFWKPEPNPQDYAELLRRSYLAAKRANPQAQIIGVNCSGIDLAFTEAVFRYGGLRYCDVLAYQPYRIAPEVGHFEEVQALRELIAQFGEPKPIWFTEMGWGTEHFPFRDADDLLAERPMRRQAAFLVRYMVIIQAAGIDKVFWFAQSAGGAGLEDRKRNAKRLSFRAYQHLIALLDGYTEVHGLHPRGAHGLYAYLFLCPDKAVVVAWSVNGPQCLRLPGIAAADEMRDMLGRPVGTPVNDEVRITGEPVYFLFGRAPQTLLRLASVTAEPSRVWLEPGKQTTVTIRNNGPAPRSFRFGASAPLRVRPNRLRVGPGEEGTLIVRVSPRALPQWRSIPVKSEDWAWELDANVTLPLLWTYQGDSEKYTQPAVLRRANGQLALVAASLDSPEIVCLSPKGELLWRYVTAAPVFDAVTVADVTGDADPEILAALPNKNTLFMLSANGVLQWHARIPGDPPHDGPSWRWTRPVVCGERIVYADAGGHLTAWSPEGATAWRVKLSEGRCDQPLSVTDVHAAPGPEILVADDRGMLYCVSCGGEILWGLDVGAAITSAPVVAALNSNDTRIFVANRNEQFICVSGRGRILWEADLGGTMDLGTGVVLAHDRIIVSTRNHEVIAFNRAGAVLWRVEAGAQFRSTPALGDFDGDGEEEVVIGSADQLLYCISLEGQVLWTANLGDRVDTSGLVADLNGDGIDEILQPVRGGKIAAFGLRPAKRSPAPARHLSFLRHTAVIPTGRRRGS